MNSIHQTIGLVFALVIAAGPAWAGDARWDDTDITHILPGGNRRIVVRGTLVGNPGTTRAMRMKYDDGFVAYLNSRKPNSGQARSFWGGGVAYPEASMKRIPLRFSSRSASGPQRARGTAQAGERGTRRQLRGTIVGNPGKAELSAAKRLNARSLVGVPPGIGLTFKKSAAKNNGGHPKARPSRKSSGKPKPHRS